MNADKWTDQALAKLEKRIAREYKQAGEEISQKATNYYYGYDEMIGDKLVHHKGMYERLAEQYATGQYTDEEFKRYAYAQAGRGAHWDDLKEQMAQRLDESAKITQGYINDILPSVYVKNSNEVSKIATESAMEQGVTGIRFDLVDEHTVKRLMEGSREVRPYKPVNIDLPKLNRYNYTKLQNALLQGILQGDSIEHMADRFMKVSNMNRASAIKNARTSVTGAQNGGKQDRYEELTKKGCDVYKMWIATADERTRDEHMEAWEEYGNEESAIPYDEPFEVGGELMMYPADTSMGASGWNVYNCRCTMRTKIKFKSVLSDDMREKANIRLK